MQQRQQAATEKNNHIYLRIKISQVVWHQTQLISEFMQLIVDTHYFHSYCTVK